MHVRVQTVTTHTITLDKSEMFQVKVPGKSVHYWVKSVEVHDGRFYFFGAQRKQGRECSRIPRRNNSVGEVQMPSAVAKKVQECLDTFKVGTTTD